MGCSSSAAAARPPRPSPSGNFLVEFVTDVEGNWEYFLQCVKLSKILCWEGDDRGVWGPGELSLREGSGIFVFGGDAQDRGHGDVRFGKTLVGLKKKFPNRVFIILGNRDVNKLRFAAELAEGEDGSKVDVYWDQRAKPYLDFIKENGLQKDSVSSLKWMLGCTMGAATSFACRQTELRLINGSEPSDEEVLRSFCDSVDPAGADPWMLDLLRHGQLGLVLDDLLFVHGGLPDDNLGIVPGQRSTAANVQDWMTGLNAWKDAQLKDFEASPTWKAGGGKRIRGGEGLIDYGVPAGANNASVVYICTSILRGSACAVPPVVERFLAASGISRVFTGHVPHGETPSIVRHPDSGLLWFTCDTSFSDVGAPKQPNPADNRGTAATLLTVNDFTVRIEGILSDGTRHGCTLYRDPNEDDVPDALVGRQLSNGAWIKTVVQDQVLSARGEGFQVINERMSPAKAEGLLTPEYKLPKAISAELTAKSKSPPSRI